MMVDKEDLGLSLTLGCSNPNTTTNHHHHHHIGGATNTFNRSLQLNLMSVAPLKNPWHHSSDRTSSDTPGGVTAATAMATGEPRSFLKGIDVNRLAALEDEAAGVSSPNSTISSSVSGKRSEREATVGAGEDLDAERACSRGISDEEDGETSRKKLRLSKDQSAVLEESFKEHSTLNPKQKLALANRLGLRPRQVEVWFQNRRARTKLKQTEVDCEYLKRCCDQLTEENRRLQKEVQELRALKHSPQFYMQMTPATTLTMCPSCERVGSTEVDSRGQGRRLSANPWGLSDSKLEAVRH